MMKSLLIFAVIALTCGTAHFAAARSDVYGGDAITVGAVQIDPVTNAGSPQQNIAATARNVMSTLMFADVKTPHDLFVLPEFLFLGGAKFTAPGTCSGHGNNASGTLSQYCSPVPPAGTSLSCADGLPLTTPARIIGCGLLSKMPNASISINVGEITTNGTLYNTQVVVRGGVVVARYRKFHPFFTTCFSKPELELVTFDVKGRKFGIFTCFDIVFKDPKMDLVHMGVKYFSYSVAMPEIDIVVELFSGENKVAVVASNADSKQSGVILDGKVLTKCMHSDSGCVATAELP